jgi:hypothetical protein
MNGQQKSEANFHAFEQWIAVQTDESFTQITHRGKLKRNDIAKACGFAKSAPTQNPRIRERLEGLEDVLREKGVLPSLSETKAREGSKAPKYDSSSSSRIMESKRLAQLEQEVLELKAKLARYEELAEVIDEIGLKL